MKPPFCSFCGSRFSPSKTRGSTLQFATSAKDKAEDQWLRDNRSVGHPKGLHWICEAHIDAAKELTHLHWPEAKAKMKRDLKIANYPKALKLLITWFRRP